MKGNIREVVQVATRNCGTMTWMLNPAATIKDTCSEDLVVGILSKIMACTGIALTLDPEVGRAQLRAIKDHLKKFEIAQAEMVVARQARQANPPPPPAP